MSAVPEQQADSLAGGPANWRAHLGLNFEPGATHTRLARLPGFGPLYVQKPFYPEGELCHVYLLHPPGGIAGGDRLSVEIGCKPGASALVTTPAANKFYRSNGQRAMLTQTISVAAGASFEWLPQETLLFGGAEAQIDTRVHLAAGARFIGWDCFCLGREASGDNFATGAVTARLEITRSDSEDENHSGASLLEETLRLEAGSPLLSEPWGLDGRRVVATLYATPADTDLLACFRRSHPTITNGTAPVLEATTLLGTLLVHRVIGPGSEAVGEALLRSWRTLRPLIMARPACPPRIWNT